MNKNVLVYLLLGIVFATLIGLIASVKLNSAQTSEISKSVELQEVLCKEILETYELVDSLEEKLSEGDPDDSNEMPSPAKSSSYCEVLKATRPDLF